MKIEDVVEWFYLTDELSSRTLLSVLWYLFFTIRCERKNAFNSSVTDFSPNELTKKLAYWVKSGIIIKLLKSKIFFDRLRRKKLIIAIYK